MFFLLYAGSPPFGKLTNQVQVISQLLKKAPIKVPKSGFAPVMEACFQYEPKQRITAKDALKMLSEIHKTECSICAEQYPPASGITCRGSTRHFVCFECFCQYVQTSCGDQSIETAVRNSQSGPETLNEQGTSPPGALPCVFFKTGGCDDVQIPENGILSALSLHDDGEITKAYLTTMGRVAVEVYRREEEERQAKIRAASALEKARLQVQEALRYGQTVPCPGCGIPTQKNHECMHMTCSRCSTPYCYVCGCNRRSGDGRCGCDSNSSFLERNPGWDRFGINGESAGEGALAEFHKRRMARFVRVVKERMDSGTWKKLKQEHPTILSGVVRGRSISWEELETAEHPKFGKGQAPERLKSLEVELISRVFS